MEIVTDMGAHAPYVWPAYGAFALIFAVLAVWIWKTNASARSELERREAARKDGR